MEDNNILNRLLRMIKNFNASKEGSSKLIVVDEYDEKVEEMEDEKAITGMLDQGRSLVGSSYKYAGNHPDEGFDCSGLVYYLFKNQGFNLPRTSRAISETGHEVVGEDRREGDILYFGNSTSDINHVGIISQLEPLKMIHSSSSKGVVETNVDGSDYWKDRLLGTRRV